MSSLNIGTIRNETNLEAVFYHDKCDAYDYLISIACGAAAGLVDIF